MPKNALGDDNKSDCVLPGGVCATDTDAEYMRRYLLTKQRSVPRDKAQVVAALMKLLSVESEAAIWEHHAFRKFVGESHARNVLNTRFKPCGPANCVDLLSDRNIDNVLAQWALHSEELFGRKFYHVPFQMIDFDKFKTEFSTLDIPGLKRKGFDCFGCVLNTDVSSGPGIHWFCVFGDLRGDTGTLEYFNSSGRRPYEEITRWRERKKLEALKQNMNLVDIDATFRRLQFTNTECGVWSLVYIRKRLEGKPPDWLATQRITDADITAYRAQLFRECDAKSGGEEGVQRLGRLG